MSLSDFFRDPFDVVLHSQLEQAVKRAILAFWASDANAADNPPAIRHPPNIALSFQDGDVIAALSDLDRGA